MNIRDKIEHWQEEYHKAKVKYDHAEQMKDMFEMEWAAEQMIWAKNKIAMLEA